MTSAGWWAVALFTAFFISVAVTVSFDSLGFDLDFTVGRFNPVGGFNLLVAIAGGAVAAFAIVRRGERSLLVLAPLMLALLALGFEVAESFFGPY